jgi:hypothetical protein
MTDELILSTPFGPFLSSIGSLFSGFVDIAKRRQPLPFLGPAKLPNGFWLTQISHCPGNGSLQADLRLFVLFNFSFLQTGLEERKWGLMRRIAAQLWGI